MSKKALWCLAALGSIGTVIFILGLCRVIPNGNYFGGCLVVLFMIIITVAKERV